MVPLVLATTTPYDLVKPFADRLGLDDVVATRYGVEDDGDTLSHEELISFVVLLYVAGHETTVNLIGNGMLALLRHPAELDRWRDDPSLDANAVDELLRYDGPVQHTVRIPMVPMSFGEGDQRVDVTPGTSVLTVLGAASSIVAVGRLGSRPAARKRSITRVAVLPTGSKVAAESSQVHWVWCALRTAMSARVKVSRDR